MGDGLAVVGGNGEGAGGGAVGNRDVALDGVGGGEADGGVRQRRGEHVVRTRPFALGRGGEVHRGIGGGVGHVGGGGPGADHQVLEIAAGDAGDAGGQTRGVLVDVLAVVGGNGEGAGGGAVGNRDVA